MFFDLRLLRDPSSPFAIPWIVSTVGVKQVSKSVILQVNIVRLCKALEKYFLSQSTVAKERLSLKLSSILLDGTALILREQATILYIDVQNAFLRAFKTESSLIALPDSMGNELFTPPLIVSKKRKARKSKRESTNDVQTFRPLFDEFEQININELEQVQPDVILQSRVDEITLRENQNVIPTGTILADDFGDFGQINLEDELFPTLDKEPVSGKPPAKRPKISKEPEPVEKLRQQPIREDITLIPPDQEVNVPPVQADVADVANEGKQQPMEQDLPVIQPQTEATTPVKRKAKATKKLDQNETGSSLPKTQNKLFLKRRPMKKLVTEKPALKALPLVGLFEKMTPSISFEIDVKPYLDRYLATAPLAPSSPPVEQIPEIIITPPAVGLGQTDIPATESLQISYTEPLLQRQQRVSDKIVEPSSSSLPTMDAAMIEIGSDFIPREPSISSNLNVSNDLKSRQNDIIKQFMDAEQDKLFELDELAGSPLNKRNAARCFSDLLDLCKAGYVNLIAEKDSQELKFIRRGRKLLN